MAVVRDDIHIISGQMLAMDRGNLAFRLRFELEL